MGFSPDLKTATEMAVRNMILFLSEGNPDYPHLSRDDAYALISTACDVNSPRPCPHPDGHQTR